MRREGRGLGEVSKEADHTFVNDPNSNNGRNDDDSNNEGRRRKKKEKGDKRNPRRGNILFLGNGPMALGGEVVVIGGVDGTTTMFFYIFNLMSH